VREARVHLYRVLYILSRYGAKRKVFHKEFIREDRGLFMYACGVNCDAYVHGARVFVRVGVVTAVQRGRVNPMYVYI